MSTIYSTIIAAVLTSAPFLVLWLLERRKRLGAESALQARQWAEDEAAWDAMLAEEKARVDAQDRSNEAQEQKWAADQEEAKKNEDVQKALDKFAAARARLRGDGT